MQPLNFKRFFSTNEDDLQFHCICRNISKQIAASRFRFKHQSLRISKVLSNTFTLQVKLFFYSALKLHKSTYKNISKFIQVEVELCLRCQTQLQILYIHIWIWCSNIMYNNVHRKRYTYLIHLLLYTMHVYAL